ncbi:hypothetical protein VP01_544g4 [Puccinia sorghi]|uniref:Uncharacterized protein n=1 Tax=Puccinia sorghi TaxID=27349 RepID=A0A0L6UJK7_9BASI|nr:hypothetical protein VP01_544g4 [Puccinia sorghi]
MKTSPFRRAPQGCRWNNPKSPLQIQTHKTLPYPLKVLVHHHNPPIKQPACDLKASVQNQRNVEEKKSQQALWPRISQDELEAIQLAIENTAVPSTVTRVPKLVGMSGNRSLKAAEWHILFCIYFPLVLVPLCLISITNLLSARSISKNEISNVHDFLIDYWKQLKDHWSGSETKPNLHISQHSIGSNKYHNNANQASLTTTSSTSPCWYYPINYSSFRNDAPHSMNP